MEKIEESDVTINRDEKVGRYLENRCSPFKKSLQGIIIDWADSMHDGNKRGSVVYWIRTQPLFLPEPPLKNVLKDRKKKNTLIESRRSWTEKKYICEGI